MLVTAVVWLQEGNYDSLMITCHGMSLCFSFPLDVHFFCQCLSHCTHAVNCVSMTHIPCVENRALKNNLLDASTLSLNDVGVGWEDVPCGNPIFCTLGCISDISIAIRLSLGVIERLYAQLRIKHSVCIQVDCQFNLLRDFYDFTLLNSGRADRCWRTSLLNTWRWLDGPPQALLLCFSCDLTPPAFAGNLVTKL